MRDFADRQVNEDALTTVFAAAQSAPTSSNLQPWSVVVIRDPARKARLATLAGDQQFIRDAPVFTVWVVDLARTDLIAAEHGRRLDGSDYLDPALVGFIDAALAAQNASLAAESLGLGTVFVGAVRNRPEEIADEASRCHHEPSRSSDWLSGIPRRAPRVRSLVSRRAPCSIGSGTTSTPRCRPCHKTTSEPWLGSTPTRGCPGAGSLACSPGWRTPAA